jgi:SprT protein
VSIVGFFPTNLKMRLNLSLKILFSTILLLGFTILFFNFQKNSKWENGEIPKDVSLKIEKKRVEMENRIRKIYGINPNFPLYISEKLPSNTFGVTTFDGQNIEIILNKKRLKESLTYILEDVIPHEFAHAVIFYFREDGGKDGHNWKWQKVCQKLEGTHCEKYVDHQDLIFQKIF